MDSDETRTNQHETTFNQTINQSIDQSPNQPIDNGVAQSIDTQSVDPATAQTLSISQSMIDLMNPPNDQLFHRSPSSSSFLDFSEQSINRAADQSIKDFASQSSPIPRSPGASPAFDQPSNRSLNQSINQSNNPMMNLPLSAPYDYNQLNGMNQSSISQPSATYVKQPKQETMGHMINRSTNSSNHSSPTHHMQQYQMPNPHQSLNQSNNQSPSHTMHQSPSHFSHLINQSTNQSSQSPTMGTPLYHYNQAISQIQGSLMPPFPSPPVIQSINQSHSQPMNQSLGSSAFNPSQSFSNHSVNRSNGSPVPFSQSMNQSMSQTIHQSMNRSLSQSLNQSLNHSVSQAMSQPASQSPTQSINQSMNQSVMPPLPAPTWTTPTPIVNLVTPEFSMSTFQLSPVLSVTCFRRFYTGAKLGPLFVVREFDSKVIRSSPKFSRAHAMLAAKEQARLEFQQSIIAQVTSSTEPIMIPNSAFLDPNTTSEQAFRASIRQAMLNMNLIPENATKSEIRVLKAQGILGKRAPSCSLLTANDMCKLLIAFGKHQIAAQLREATQLFLAQNIGTVPAPDNNQLISPPNTQSLGHSSISPPLLTTAQLDQANSETLRAAEMNMTTAMALRNPLPSPNYQPAFPTPNQTNRRALTVDVNPEKRRRKRKPDVLEPSQPAALTEGLDALISAVDSIAPGAKPAQSINQQQMQHMMNAYVTAQQVNSHQQLLMSMPSSFSYHSSGMSPNLSLSQHPMSYPHYDDMSSGMMHQRMMPPPVIAPQAMRSPSPHMHSGSGSPNSISHAGFSSSFNSPSAFSSPIPMSGSRTLPSLPESTQLHMSNSNNELSQFDRSPTPILARVHSTDSQSSLSLKHFDHKFEVNDDRKPDLAELLTHGRV